MTEEHHDSTKPMPPFECELQVSADLPSSRHKLVFLGDVTVGKTSIVKRYIYARFDDSYKVTIGIDFLNKTVCLDDRIVHLQLWDTAGQERFRALTPSYVRDSSVAIVVYDVTSRATLLNTDQWITDIRNEREDVRIVLVGNKTDLTEKRQVSRDEGEQKAKEHDIMFIETSAKSGSNITNLFQQLAIALSSDGKEGQMSGELQNVNLKAIKNDDGLNEDGCMGMCWGS